MEADNALVDIDQALDEWKVWLENLKGQIYDLHHRRQLHDEFMELLDRQDHPDTGILGDAFHRMYIESQVMAIRRLADDDKRTISLRRLIGQIEQRRPDFTRDWYVARWMSNFDLASADERTRLKAEFQLRNANSSFDKFTDTEGDPQIGGRRLQEDRDELVGLTDELVQYTNGIVAHAQRDPLASTVTYGEFYKSIDHIGSMLKRYHLLIDQGGLMTVVPVIQGDWKGPFRKPLVR